jgi:hypothetical protein
MNFGKLLGLVVLARTCLSFHVLRRREDLNLRGAFKTPTSLAVRRTRPGYATSPRTLEV